MIGHDQIEYASLTDVGVRRSHNQDAHASLPATDEEQWQDRGHVFLVADGMGAHAVGELASELSVGIIPHTYYKHAQQGPVQALRKSFIEANATIHNKGQQNREFEGMGTTTTALLLRPEGAWIGHVGDSRCYRIRNGSIEQLTFDHSLQWELARRQGVDPNGLQGIPTNVIVRSLGPEPFVQVDVEGPHELAGGDIFLLCSDGLNGQVSDGEMGAIASGLPPAEACRFLVDLANLRGGPDNITVVIVRIAGGNLAAPPMPTKKEPAPARVPWPFAALTLGLVLLTTAAILTYQREVLFGIISLLLGGGLLGAGLVGLTLQHTRDQRRLSGAPVDHPEPRIHRQRPCPLERPIIEQLAKAAVTLKQRIEEKNWEADFAAYQSHYDKANSLLKENQLLDSFQEFCRSMRPLNETLQRLRNKEESFHPVWDKGA